MKRLKTLYGIFMVLLIWQLLSFFLDSNVLPMPLEAFKVFVTLFRSELLPHLLVSIYRMFLALSLSLILGISLGILCGWNQTADELLSPIAYILYPLPKIAFLPIFMIFLGIGDASKVTLMISIVFFQILLAVRDGIKEIPTSLIRSMESLNLSLKEKLIHLIFPAMLPKLFSSLRISLGICIATLFFAENYATTYGIGYLIMNAWAMVDYPKMFAGIIALSMLGFCLFKGLDYLEKKCCPWLFP